MSKSPALTTDAAQPQDYFCGNCKRPLQFIPVPERPGMALGYCPCYPAGAQVETDIHNVRPDRLIVTARNG